MRSISIDSNDGLFEGTIMLFVRNTEHLNKLIEKLKQAKGILSVARMD
ncbi:MAG: ACT domain-containing protein [Bacteroidota bacterium]